MVRVESDMKEKIVPNMEPLFLSYERHKCLCGFLTMQHFSSEDFAKELRYLPEDNRFYHGLLNLYEQNDSDFINQHTKGVVLDFIGGEPLLEAALIERICDYWFAECWRG